MTILTSAYDTTACRNYNRASIQNPLIALFLMGGTTPRLNGKVQSVEKYISGTGQLPAFNYPFIDQRDGKNESFVDMRSLTSYDEVADKLRIRDMTAYTNKLIVGSIAKDWADNNVDRYLTSFPLALRVYTSWVSEAVTGRFAIDAAAQMKVAVLAAILYINNFCTEEQSASRDHKAMVQAMITRHCDIVSPDVNSIVQEYSDLSDLDSFCIAAKDYTQNIRLKDFNVATLFESVGGWWVGNNGRETMAVCLEYPPLWLGVVLASLTDRGVRSTRLSKITDRHYIKKDSEKFIRSMLAMGIEN